MTERSSARLFTDVATKRELNKATGVKLGIPSTFFVTWYAKYGRAFPWRAKNVSSYGILLAEVLLRQTRAEMAARVWPLLVKECPDPCSLTIATPTHIFNIVEELGFGKQRTRVLLELGASIKASKKLPSEPEELIKLPHVGLYTAHAVACFGFGCRVPVVDLNVVRVISRITGIDPPKDIRRRADYVWEIAGNLLPRKKVTDHNYGLLDFAATICKPRSPKCAECLIVSHCYFGRSKVGQMRGCDR